MSWIQILIQAVIFILLFSLGMWVVDKFKKSRRNNKDRLD